MLIRASQRPNPDPLQANDKMIYYVADLNARKTLHTVDASNDGLRDDLDSDQ